MYEYSVRAGLYMTRRYVTIMINTFESVSSANHKLGRVKNPS